MVLWLLNLFVLYSLEGLKFNVKCINLRFLLQDISSHVKNNLIVFGKRTNTKNLGEHAFT